MPTSWRFRDYIEKLPNKVRQSRLCVRIFLKVFSIVEELNDPGDVLTAGGVRQGLEHVV